VHESGDSSHDINAREMCCIVPAPRAAKGVPAEPINSPRAYRSNPTSDAKH